MRLLIFRHGPAGTREEWARTGRPDRERPLTDEGRETSARAAAGIRALVPELAVLATSPFARAAQTAVLLQRAYGGMPMETVDALASGGDRAALMSWLDGQPDDGTIAIVGHNPDLEERLAWLVAGHERRAAALAKAGAALVELPHGPAPGGGMLRWLMRPDALAALGR